MTRLRTHCSSVFFTLALLAALPAAAQSAGGSDFSVGWRVLKASDAGVDGASESFPLGWYADTTFPIADRISVVGDISGSYKSIDETATALGTTVTNSANIKIHSFMGGLRYSFPQQPRLAPFGQVLFGLAHGSTSVDRSVTVGDQTTASSLSDSSNEFALDMGAGITVAATDRVNLRVSASYLRIGADNGSNGLRLSLGVVYPF